MKDSYNLSTCYSRNFKSLAKLCSWAGRFESYLVATPRRQVFSWRGSYSFFDSCLWPVSDRLLSAADTVASKSVLVVFSLSSIIELPHDKNQQNDLCAQSDQSLRCPHEETLGPQLPIEHTAKTDQTGWKPRLIRVFTRHKGHFVGFVMWWLNRAYPENNFKICASNILKFHKFYGLHETKKYWKYELDILNKLGVIATQKYIEDIMKYWKCTGAGGGGGGEVQMSNLLH